MGSLRQIVQAILVHVEEEEEEESAQATCTEPDLNGVAYETGLLN